MTQLRLPRVVLGLLVGAMLALAGGCYQGVFRNPLADPYLLGRRRRRRTRRDRGGRARASRPDIDGGPRQRAGAARSRSPARCSASSSPTASARPVRRVRTPDDAAARRRGGGRVPHRDPDLHPAAQRGDHPRGLLVHPRQPGHDRLGRGTAGAAVRRASRPWSCWRTGASSTCSRSATRRRRASACTRSAPADPAHRGVARHRRRGGRLGSDRLRRHHRAAHDPAHRRHQLPADPAAVDALRRRVPGAVATCWPGPILPPTEVPIGVVTAFLGAPFFVLVLRTAKRVGL